MLKIKPGASENTLVSNEAWGLLRYFCQCVNENSHGLPGPILAGGAARLTVNN